jgi:hypothetical protein
MLPLQLILCAGTATKEITPVDHDKTDNKETPATHQGTSQEPTPIPVADDWDDQWWAENMTEILEMCKAYDEP